MATYTNVIEKLYIAYFGRPADKAGLDHWEGILVANGGNQKPVYDAFSVSQEYLNLHASQTTSQLVSSLYLYLFGRSSDSVGLAYWVDLIDTNKLKIADVAATLIWTAEQTPTGADALAMNKKAAAATTFTSNIDSDAELAGYPTTNTSGPAQESARAFMSSILAGSTAPTDAAVIAALAAAVSAGSGATIALTTGIDTYSTTSTPALTANTDTITGALNTLGSTDKLVDGSTTDADTLSVELTANVDSTVTLTNIENLTFTSLSGTRVVDNTLMTGVKTITHTGSGSLSLTNVASAATTFNMTNTGGTFAVTHKAAAVTGGADNVGVTLSGVAAGSKITVNGAVESVSLVSGGTAANVLSTLDAVTPTTLTVTGGMGLTLGTEGVGGKALTSNFSTLDLRTAGVVDVRIAGDGTGTSVLTGSSADKITVTAPLAAGDLFSMGNGSDTLTLDGAANGAATLTGVESIISTAASSTIDLASANQAAALDFRAGKAIAANNLTAGTTVKSTVAAATTVAVGYQGTVLAQTLNLDLQKGATGVTATNVKDLTVTLGEASVLAAAIAVDDLVDTTQATTALKIVANGAVTGTQAVTKSSLVTDFTIDANAAITLAEFDEAEALTTLTLNANKGAIIMSTIGAGGSSAAKLSTVNATSTVGGITIGATTATNATDIAAINVVANGGTVALNTITNSGAGFGTLTVSGSQDVTSNLTVAMALDKVDTVNASAHTGSLTSVITNTLPAGSAGTTATLGNAATSKINSITIIGAMNDTVTGGSGIDVIDGGRGSDSLDGGAGASDTVAYTAVGGNNFGQIINIGSTTLYLNNATAANATAATTVAANTAYDRTAAGLVDTIATANKDSIANFERVVGSAQADQIFGSTSANIITGGAGRDVMTGAGAADTFAFAAGVTDTVAAAASIAGVDLINDLVFDAATNDLIDLTVAVATVGTAVTGAVAEATFVANMSTLLKVAAGAGFDTATVGGISAAVVIATGGLAGRVFLAVDINADDDFTTADFVVEITGSTVTSLTTASFI